MRKLTILNVAFPFAPVGPDSVGGAEQIVWQLDRALVSAGHVSLVAASPNSQVAGIHVPFFSEADRRKPRDVGWQLCKDTVEKVVASSDIDLVHMHGVDFFRYLPNAPAPVLATLHLPPCWYPREIFAEDFFPRLRLQCVSQSQLRACPSSRKLLPVISNGVDVCRGKRRRKGAFALTLGRICPEKGFHLAIRAAALAKVPMLLAGEVFEYQEHQAHFRREIAPSLGRGCRFIGPVGGNRKWRLLSTARCVVVPSLVPETSSLVAMEALASGTPVVAFRKGALPEVIEHGKTGFVVDTVEQMAQAIGRAHEISAEQCIAAARERFDVRRMAAEYLARYAQLSEQGFRCEGEQRTATSNHP